MEHWLINFISSSVCDRNESDLLAEQATIGKHWNCDSCVSRILVYVYNLFAQNEAVEWIRNDNKNLIEKLNILTINWNEIPCGYTGSHIYYEQ